MLEAFAADHVVMDSFGIANPDARNGKYKAKIIDSKQLERKTYANMTHFKTRLPRQHHNAEQSISLIIARRPDLEEDRSPELGGLEVRNSEEDSDSLVTRVESEEQEKKSENLRVRE
ncbi:unnamed protein product [Dovyalis caffra]|uniref:Uncharacterized protein n=1 Tax=Dovyalis caffra TaxID=77055 RepID=A0AAV1SFI8_9ROSI|nr:unnamed protein product [Dovyalis caffra]